MCQVPDRGAVVPPAACGGKCYFVLYPRPGVTHSTPRPSLFPPTAGAGEIVYSDLHLGPAGPADATAVSAGHAMDGYASLAPDEALAASQQQARGARLAEQTGYVDWALVAPARASGGDGGGQTYAVPLATSSV